MTPCRLQQLPLKHLDWERFVEILGKAHETIARFELLVGDEKLLREREIGAQQKGEREAYAKLLAFSSKAVKSSSLSTRFLCQMHNILLPGQKGKFRKKQNWIGPKGCTRNEAYFLPPVFEKVPEGMGNLSAYGKRKEKDPLVHLAIYFAQLLIIHPFMDANGRLARALIPLFLYKKGKISSPRFYMSAYFKRRRLEYFEKLYLISTAKDWEGWISFFLQGMVEEGEKIIRQCRRFHSFSSSS